MPTRPFQIEYPRFAENRGAGFWLRPANIVAARRKFRVDHSSRWRDVNERAVPRAGSASVNRTRSYLELLPGRGTATPIRAVILGDPGDGDKSQYGLVPLIRALKPHFMIINGDVAYPSGRERDYVEALFEPYNDLGIPIWAVPGNHEYYSPYNGREFVDVFCGRKFINEWKRHGLRFVPQPGTYWELGDPMISRVRIIGIDSGHSGRLNSPDYDSSDARQMTWLRKRLEDAEKRDDKIILLFHFPTLVNGSLDDKTNLVELHKLIATMPSVRAVICAHTHNFQAYTPDVFGRALRDLTGVDAARAPDYMVSGGGGAYLSAPPQQAQPTYEPRADSLFPTAEYWEAHLKDWRSYTKPLRRLVAKVGLGQSLVDRMAASLEEGAMLDSDKTTGLSLLYLEIEWADAVITPVFLDDLSSIYADDVDLINIQNTNPLPDPPRVDAKKRPKLSVKV